jgi:hypothetical protein
MDPSLDSREHLRSLVARYAQALDATDVAGVLACMHPAATISYNAGAIRIDRFADLEPFFRKALTSPSTHLIANHTFETSGEDVFVGASAIACVKRVPGQVTLRGLVYRFLCTNAGTASRIRRIEHRCLWEGAAPTAWPATH